MIKSQFASFVIRWLISSVGMWIVISLFGQINNVDNQSLFWLYASAGFIFSVINTFIKPVITVLSLPFIIISLGLFTLVINAAIVSLAIWLLPNVTMSFWGAFLSSIIIGLINWIANILLPGFKDK